MADDPLVLVVKLDRVSDHQVLGLLSQRNSLGLMTVATVRTVSALRTAILNGESFLLSFLHHSQIPDIFIIID